MSDQKRWFKLWYSACSDDGLIALPPELRWAWAVLGAHTKIHGTEGVVSISSKNHVLAAMMGVTVDTLIDTITSLPHIHVEEGQNHNGEFTVTWDNWIFYQEDSTVAERQKKWRELHRNGLRGEERRGEENKKRIPPIVPQTGDTAFDQFWKLYPKKVGKKAAQKAWHLARVNGQLSQILTAIELQKKSAQWNEESGRFIPNPATWINQGRWMDEPVKERTMAERIRALGPEAV